MAKNNFIEFNIANDYVINKDKSISYYIQYMLSRTQSMFAYTGLPETIPQTKLEMMLQTKGFSFITEVEGKLYALSGSLGGELDAYEDYTEITVANPALKLTKTYNIENDGVLINNDALRIGIIPILSKYGSLLAENTITMRTVDIILRMVCMISASDDRTYTGAEKFIKDIENGKISAIGESAFFEGIRVHSVANSQNYMAQFIEYEQYLKASCANELGLNANYNMKHEKIGSNEAAMNDDFLLPFVDNMIKERQTALNKINEMFGTDISIDYASAWKVTHSENEKQIAISESIASQVDSGNDLDVEISQKEGAHDINRPLINIEGGENNAEKEEPTEDVEEEPTEDVEEEPTEDSGELTEDVEEEPTEGEKDGDEDERNKS